MSTNSTNSNNQFPNSFPTISSGKLTAKIIIKSDYVRADGTCAIYLQMFLNGKRKRVNLDIYVPEDAFDKLKMRVKKSFKNSKDLNLIIEKALADVNHIEVMHRYRYFFWQLLMFTLSQHMAFALKFRSIFI